MRLKNITFKQYPNTSIEWGFENLSIEDINVIVGRNATGKTKTLNVINNLANLVTGIKKMDYDSGYFEVHFSKMQDSEFIYVLQYENKKIIKEVFKSDKMEFFTRNEDGRGKIWFEDKKDTIDIQIPNNELICASRRDSLQHPFLEDLFRWANNLSLFRFGSHLGKDKFIIGGSIPKDILINLKDTEQTPLIYLIGHDKYGEKFFDAVKDDMKSIGYYLDKVTIGPQKNITIEFGLIGSISKSVNLLPFNLDKTKKPIGINIYESDLSDSTDQIDMSQGMFRAFSLIIHINYMLFSGEHYTLLIDDMGEGLDYDRSSKLVELLFSKVKDTNIQLIIATNDRFVMNKVPLNYWTIISREKGKTKFYNYHNSKDIFDRFESIGLNNFDFLSSNYYLQQNQ